MASDNPELNYRLFKILEANPNLTQRQMAGERGIILGKFGQSERSIFISTSDVYITPGMDIRSATIG